MSLNVKEGNKSGDFEITPEGTYIARCFKVIDLGTQKVEFAGDTKYQQKVMISWELLDPENVRMKDGKPFAASKRYTASLHEKASLRKDLQNWRGKKFTEPELEGFDLKKILGSYCQVQVIHTENNGNTYANVDAIMSTKEKPKPVNPDVYFDISEPDMEVFNNFSDNMKKIIESSLEWDKKDELEEQPPAKPDVVIEDIPDEEIDLSEIPF